MKKLNLVPLLLAVFLTLMVGLKDASANYWEKISPNPCGGLYAVYDPQDKATLLALMNQRLSRSSDNGFNWNDVGLNKVNSVFVAQDNSVYAIVESKDDKVQLYKSGDQGQSWKTISDLPQGTGTFAALPDNSFIIGVPGRTLGWWEIYRSTDSGARWEYVWNGGGYRLEVAPDGTVFAQQVTSLYLGRSTDGGKTWSRINKTIAFEKLVFSPDYTNDKRIYGYTPGGTIYRSEDGGDNWIQDFAGKISTGGLSDIVFSPNYASDRTIAIVSNSSEISISRDGGVFWNSVAPNLPSGLTPRTMLMTKEGEKFIATAEGIYKVVKDKTEQVKPAINSKFTLLSNYYYINFDKWLMDVAPYVKDGRTFVPVRYLAYSLGLKDDDIKWDNSKETVTLSKGNTVIKLTVGSNTLIVNDKLWMMDVKPELFKDRIMLPARFVAEALGAKVTWNEEENSVYIES